MKRKIVAVIMALALCCGAALTVSAAGAGDAAGDPSAVQPEETAGSPSAVQPGEAANDGPVQSDPAADQPDSGTVTADSQMQSDPAVITDDSQAQLQQDPAEEQPKEADAGQTQVQEDPAAEPYQGVLKQENCYNGGSPEMGKVIPVQLSDLTEAQQNVMRSVYEGLENLDVSGGRDAAWPAEKAVLDPFLSDVMGEKIDCCGLVFGKMDYYAPLITFIGSPNPDFIVLQLKEDGTWQDIDAKWSGGMNEIGFTLQSQEEPVLICFIDVPIGSRGDELTLDNYLKQIYRNKITYDDLSSTGDLTSQQQQIVSGIMLKLEEKNYNSLEESEQLATALTVFSDLLKVQTGTVVTAIEKWGCLNIRNVGNLDLSGGREIEFPAPGIKPGDEVVVLHLKDDGTWEKIPATAGDWKITGTFTSLSPVYYFKVKYEEPNVAVQEPSAQNAPHEHTWQTTVVAPTADSWGYTTYGCNECGYHYEDSYVAPTGQRGSGRSVSPKTSESILPYTAVPAAFLCLGIAAVIAGDRKRKPL